VQDTRVPLLREKLGLSAEASDLVYDAALAAAVRKFQQANELPATGSLDARTVKALNAPVKDWQIETIIANMERWRWYPRDLGRTHVIVNHPEFTLKVMHGGAQVWTTRIVIGHPSRQRPLLSQTMTSITVNPTWRVPPSMVNDYLSLRTPQDPTVLDRMGMSVSYSSGGVQITQAPGDNNALGRVRFNFHNRFIVYQHDTPEKDMFARSPAPTATAACAYSIPPNMPRFCSTSRGPASTGRLRGSRACSAPASRTFSCRPRPSECI
jgi:murein L,D-transpeptidase YcbB/YkuD